MNYEIDPHCDDIGEGPVIHSGIPVSNVLYELAYRTQEVLGESHPRSLIVGTHPQIPLVGDGLLPFAKYEEADRTRIVDTPAHVLERLRSLLHTHYRKYACVVAAFESHHFGPEERRDFVDLLQQFSHGTVIMTDYALAGAAPETVRKDTQTRVETLQQQMYGGFEKWLPSHTVFTPKSFLASMRETEWNSFQGFQTPQNKVGMIASPILSPDELRKIYKSAL